MKKIAIAVHGGAGNITAIKEIQEREAALEQALRMGYRVIKRSGSAIRAVKVAVMALEDNPLFNAGRGSALNNKGKVEMDAAIMDGKTLAAGAVASVQQVKNPIELAYTIMKKTKHVLSCQPALA